jgi:hypothetical protein
MENVIIKAGSLPLVQIKGKHVVAAFFVGTLVGASRSISFNKKWQSVFKDILICQQAN